MTDEGGRALGRTRISLHHFVRQNCFGEEEASLNQSEKVS